MEFQVEQQRNTGVPEYMRKVSVIDDLYLLGCIFFSSKAWMDYDGYGMKEIKSLYEMDLIEKILLSTAIQSRNRFDKFPQSFVDGLSPVGKIEDKGIESALTIRVCLNKIIHAKKMNYDVESPDGIYNAALNPIMYLYGEDIKKNTWRCTVQIERYIAVLLELSHLGYE